MNKEIDSQQSCRLLAQYLADLRSVDERRLKYAKAIKSGDNILFACGQLDYLTQQSVLLLDEVKKTINELTKTKTKANKQLQTLIKLLKLFRRVISRLITIRKNEIRKIARIRQAFTETDQPFSLRLWHQQVSKKNRVKVLEKALKREVQAIKELHTYYTRSTEEVQRVVKILKKERMKKIALRPVQAALSAVSIPTPLAGSVFVVWFAIEGVYGYINKTFSQDMRWLESLVEEKKK